MAANKLWASKTAEPWAAVQQSLSNVWQDHANERLQELNSWYEDELPAAIASRAPDRHMTAAQLVQLVDWKLNYGKWRPRLLDYAKAATEQQVQEASRKAFSLLLSSSSSDFNNPRPASPTAQQSAAQGAAAPANTEGKPKRKQRSAEQPSKPDKRAKLSADAADASQQDDIASPTAAAAAAAAEAGQPSPAAVKAALDALTVLKGVGPATASAALAVADGSGSTPYMGDEALQAACGGKDYTVKAYLLLLEALRDKADTLAQQDPDGGWTAVQVERCLHAAALQEKGAPAARKAAAAAAKPSRGGKAGSKASAAGK